MNAEGERPRAGSTDLGQDRGEEADEEISFGPLKTWRSVYIAVLVYTAVLVGLLYLLTRALDHSIG